MTGTVLGATCPDCHHPWTDHEPNADKGMVVGCWHVVAHLRPDDPMTPTDGVPVWCRCTEPGPAQDKADTERIAVPGPGQLVADALGTVAAVTSAREAGALSFELGVVELLASLVKVQAAAVVLAAGSIVDDAPPAEPEPTPPRFLGDHG